MSIDLTSFLGQPPDPLRLIADRKIAEWIESGGPAQLTNLGQPLDLSDNPFTPQDLRLAYKVMANANLAPDWIQIGSEIERLVSDYREATRRYQDAQRHDQILLRTASAEAATLLRRRSKRRSDDFRDAQRARIRHVNSQIDRFNVACPVAHLHRVRLNVEREVESALESSTAAVA